MKYAPVSLIAACIFPLALSSHAAVLMLDFGPTGATGSDSLNSPYHVSTPSFTDTTWNTLGTADVAAGGVVNSTGAVATGVSLDLGVENGNNSQTIDFATVPGGNSALGTIFNTGIFAGAAPSASPARDGIFFGSGSTNRRAIALRIGGLAAGEYEIYIMGVNTNTVGAGGLGDAVSYHHLLITNAAPATQAFVNQTGGFGLSYSQHATWVENTNYVKFSFTLEANQYVTLINQSNRGIGAGGEQRGLLNMVQVVSIVPEPGVGAMVVASAAALMIVVRRRHTRG